MSSETLLHHLESDLPEHEIRHLRLSVFSVSSSSRKGLTYLLTIDPDTGAMTCPCSASKFGTECRHRTAVLNRIAAYSATSHA